MARTGEAAHVGARPEGGPRPAGTSRSAPPPPAAPARSRTRRRLPAVLGGRGSGIVASRRGGAPGAGGWRDSGRAGRLTRWAVARRARGRAGPGSEPPSRLLPRSAPRTERAPSPALRPAASLRPRAACVPGRVVRPGRAASWAERGLRAAEAPCDLCSAPPPAGTAPGGGAMWG